VGLKSLSRINRSGSYDFWENMWESDILYKQHFFTSYSLKKILSETLNFFFMKYLFKKGFKGLGYYNLYKAEFFFKFLVFFSKVWVLKYQNWFIIFMYYYNLTKFFKKKIKYKSVRYNYRSFYKISMNYNYQFKYERGVITKFSKFYSIYLYKSFLFK